MNKVIMMGRLTKDPDIRYSGGEKSMCIAHFSIAVDRRQKGKDGIDVDFFNCSSFGKQGEFVEKYLKKGTKILLSGRIQNDNYTNRDGQKVQTVQMLNIPKGLKHDLKIYAAKSGKTITAVVCESIEKTIYTY